MYLYSPTERWLVRKVTADSKNHEEASEKFSRLINRLAEKQQKDPPAVPKDLTSEELLIWQQNTLVRLWREIYPRQI